MKELIKKRHLIPIAVWFVIYMGLFGFLEIVPPKEVHLIHCALDDMIPHMAVFIYPYVSWFPYIVLCAYLAIKNLDDRQFKKAGTGSDHRHEHFPVHFLRVAYRTEPP